MKQSLSDTRTGVTLFAHVIDGIHIGPMTPDLPVGMFSSMVTVGSYPGAESGRVHHRHMPLDPDSPDMDQLDEAAAWVRYQAAINRRTLVRSDIDLHRPSLVVGVAILLMGGHEDDALACLDRAYPLDDRYREIFHRCALRLTRS